VKRETEEIEITTDMSKAGERALLEWCACPDAEIAADTIYEAMYRLRPQPKKQSFFQMCLGRIALALAAYRLGSDKLRGLIRNRRSDLSGS